MIGIAKTRAPTSSRIRSGMFVTRVVVAGDARR